MSLTDPLNNSTKASYSSSSFNLDDFTEIMNKFSEEKANDRNFSVWTGTRGMELFHMQMRRQCAFDQLKQLPDSFTDEEYDSIVKMIESEDDENLVVAETIMDIKQQDGASV